jgi:hypothetical protein
VCAAADMGQRVDWRQETLATGIVVVCKGAGCRCTTLLMYLPLHSYCFNCSYVMLVSSTIQLQLNQ